MSLSVAKSVWNALGANGDDYVKFNTGNYVSSGDPHGAASPVVEGKYLHDLFYGTQTLTEEEATRLNTDPYALNVSNGQTESPYDYYWGGYNTITGGQDGINGTDGWYFYKLPDRPAFQLLPPIDSDGSSVFKQGSTVPVKFQLLDQTGAAITDAKAAITIAEVTNDKVGEEQAAVSTSGAVSGNAFRYDEAEGLYIFNLSTKSLHKGTYRIQIQYTIASAPNAANTEYAYLRLR